MGEKFDAARATLEGDEQRVFDELVRDYRFAAEIHAGRAIAHPAVCAELVRMGWRFVGPTAERADRAAAATELAR